jgi:cyclopropane fatty-acyl-phospholipid synthase-like methyltransferase
MNTRSLAKAYDRLADEYLANRDEYKNDEILDKLVTKLPSGAKVLDVGCGSGIPVCKYLDNKGFTVTGLDFSKKQIELAKGNVPNSSFFQRDMQDLKEKEFRVDAIICLYALNHIPREKHLETLRKFRSYLPLSGQLYITVDIDEFEGEGEIEHAPGAKLWWSQYDEETNKRLLREAGFKIWYEHLEDIPGEKHLHLLAEGV